MQDVAVKIESKSVKVPQLMYEARIYRQFADLPVRARMRTPPLSRALVFQHGVFLLQLCAVNYINVYN